jgi:WD40 repeat protein
VLAIMTGGVPDVNELSLVPPRGAVLWEFATGRVTQVNAPEGREVRCLAFSPNGSRIAVLFGRRRTPMAPAPPWDGVVHLLNETGVELHSWPVQAEHAIQTDCHFTTDGNSLVLTASKGRTEPGAAFETRSEVWDVKSSPPKLTTSRQDGLAAWDRAGIVVATATNKEASATNLVTKATAVFPSRRDDRLVSAVFTADARRLATSATDNRVRIWDAITGNRILTLVGHRSPVVALAFSPDGNVLVSSTSQGEVKQWNTRTGQLVRDLPRFRTTVMGLAFSPDGKKIVVVSRNDRVAIFDAATGADLLPEWPGKLPRYVSGVAFSGDGKQLGLSGDTITVFDSAALRELKHSPSSPGGPTGGLYANRNGSVWATGESNGVGLWTPGQPWRYLKGSRDGNSALAYQLAFSRDQKRLVTPGVENTVRIWDTATAKEIATLYHAAADGMRMKAVAFSPDERQVHAVGDNGSLYRFPVSLDDLIVEAKKRLK